MGPTQNQSKWSRMALKRESIKITTSNTFSLIAENLNVGLLTLYRSAFPNMRSPDSILVPLSFICVTDELNLE